MKVRELQLVILGLNHQSAPIELRERMAVLESCIPSFLERLSCLAGVEEALLLSTCNRVELYLAAKDPETLALPAKQFLAEAKEVLLSELDPHLYYYTGKEAILHGFKVASGLDSMVLGEPQILGQIKQAYQTALASKSTGVFLNKYFNQVLQVAKRVRTETRIGAYSMSVSAVAVKLAKRIFGEFKDHQVLLVGAGKMAEQAARYLKEQGASRLWITNRSFERAEKLAFKYSGQPIHFDEFKLLLPQIDILITSATTSDYLIRQETIREAMAQRKNKPMFLIDIALPRNIDPSIGSLYNTYLYDLDDLQSVVENHHRERIEASQEANSYLQQGMESFLREIEERESVPLIQEIHQKWNKTCAQELDRIRPKLAGWTLEQKEVLEQTLQSFLKKILHDPVSALKGEPLFDGASREEVFQIVRRLFGI